MSLINNMKRISACRVLFRVVGLAMLSTYALATTDSNKTVVALGVQGGSTYAVAYFTAAEGFSISSCGYIYIDVTNNFGKAAYADILMAKTTGRKLARIDYAQDGNGTCYLSLVEVQS